MEKINSLSVPFYKFVADKELNDQVLSCVSKLDFQNENIIENGYIYPDFFHDKLFDFFDSSIRQLKTVYFKDNLEFPIVDCWVNKFTALNRLYKHKHSNSVICGVYYVTSHDANSSTIFELPNPWQFSAVTSPLSLSIDKSEKMITEHFIPEAGTLILFPSPIFHYMNVIKNTSTIRYTVAFNTFPSGELSNDRTQSLSITTRSLRHKANNL